MRAAIAHYSKILLLLLLFLTTAILPGMTQIPATHNVISTSASSLVEQGRQLYESGEHEQAIGLLEQAITNLERTGDRFNLAMALSNLSLVRQQLGQWQRAEAEITRGVSLLQTPSPTLTQQQLLAQIFLVQGQLHLATGKPEAALQSWRAAADRFGGAGDRTGMIRSQIFQSIALRELGFYRQALKTVIEPVQWLQEQPNSQLKAIALRELGDVLRVVGDTAELETTFPFLHHAIETYSIDCTISGELVQGTSPPSFNTAQWLQRSLMNAQLWQSHQVLQQSISILQSMQPEFSQDLAEAFFSLGNTYQAAYERTSDAFTRVPTQVNEQSVQEFQQKAIAAFQSAAQSPQPLTRIQAHLSQRQLGVASADPKEQTSPAQQWHHMAEALTALPTSRSTLITRLRFAQTWLHDDRLAHPISLPLFLETTLAQARILNDKRNESYALGLSARWQEKTYDLIAAQTQTQQALELAESIPAPEIAYLWQWQLGRILHTQAQELQDQGQFTQAEPLFQQATIAYEQSVETINWLRDNYLSGLENPDVSFSFRDDVEPVYRELLGLYLRPLPNQTLTTNDAASLSQVSATELNRVTAVLEKLQVLELENALRCRLQDFTSLPIEQATEMEDSHAAVLYPVVFEDRLEVLLKLPNDPQIFRRTTPNISSVAIEKAIANLRSAIERADRTYTNSTPPPSAAIQLYEWIFGHPQQPDHLENLLQSHAIQTVVVVLSSGSSGLRNIPFAALHDGDRYLVTRDYSVIFNVGTKILSGKRFDPKQIRVLAAGISDPNQDPQTPQCYPQLEGVTTLLNYIQPLLNPQILRNQEFTPERFGQTLNAAPFDVVHLATHGQFSSSLEDTFVLAYHERLDMNQFSRLLQSRGEKRSEPIELLILNACQTATGDQRAGLGIAGIAIQSGVRSAIASLYDSRDNATAELMQQFYQNLLAGMPSSKAFHQAQAALLQTEHSALYQWAPFVFVGNWR
jgi:CHAT domain-containing protein